MPGCGFSSGRVRLLPQDTQHAPQFTQGLAAGVADQLERLFAAFGGDVGRVGAAVGQRDDDGQIVADDVVHLAGHPGALGDGGQPAALVPLDLQLPRAIAQARQGYMR